MERSVTLSVNKLFFKRKEVKHKMTNFSKKLTTAIATGALLAQSAAPVAFASTTIEISGNGAGSDNVVSTTQTSTTTVQQNNVANVTNKVNADADTGNNDANYNTGGNVVVDTGDATVNAHVSNDLNSNYADVENCNCAQDTDVLVSGNGAFSDNTVATTNYNAVNLGQNNVADVYNKVNVDADTGRNDAGFNTGNGDVVIKTGKATVNASVSTSANTNVASIGGNGNGATASFRILDNGAGADNVISATIANTTELAQNNVADVDNYVDADADTGKNDANFNTGDGWVVIDTGNATVNAGIANDVNFNAADVDCGCVYDVLAKIAGNGAEVGHGYDSEADNTIVATLTHAQALGQNNVADLMNDYDGWTTDTGNNEASKNTAGSDSDPAIFTGNALVNTAIENSGNTNILGDVSMPVMPDFDFDWNWAAMFAYFGMSHNS